MGTIIVLAIIVVIAGLALRSLIQDKKKGITCRCGGNCSSCAGNCSTAGADKKKKDSI